MNSFQDLLKPFCDYHEKPIKKHDILLHNCILYIAIEIDYKYTNGISCLSIQESTIERVKDTSKNLWYNKITFTNRNCIIVSPSIIDFLEPGSKKIYEELIKLI